MSGGASAGAGSARHLDDDGTTHETNFGPATLVAFATRPVWAVANGRSIDKTLHTRLFVYVVRAVSLVRQAAWVHGRSPSYAGVWTSSVKRFATAASCFPKPVSLPKRVFALHRHHWMARKIVFCRGFT